jgi:hypothetical protein
MLVNNDKKIIILLTPRCASTSLALMYSRLTGFDYLLNNFCENLHHHVRMLSIVNLDYEKYEIFLVYRPILCWVKSCYSNFSNNYTEKAKYFLLDDFINNNGVDIRVDPVGWDWFSHSPENMIIDKNGNIFKCKKYHFVNLKNIKEDLFDVLERDHGICPLEIIHSNDSTKYSENQTITDYQAKIIEKLCCPLNVLPKF